MIKLNEKTRFLRIRMPTRWVDELANLAETNGETLTGYVQTLIANHLAKEPKDEHDYTPKN